MLPNLVRVCAGVLLFAVTGCTVDSFLAPQFVVYGPKRLVPGTVSQTAAQISAGLSDAGIVVTPKQAGDEMRLAGISASGTVFCLHLYEKKGTAGRSTMVRMQWDRGGEEALWKLVLRSLDASEPDSVEKP